MILIMRYIYKDKYPSKLGELYDWEYDRTFSFSENYCPLSRSYYYSFLKMGDELIDMVEKNNLNDALKIFNDLNTNSTPYQIMYEIRAILIEKETLNITEYKILGEMLRKNIYSDDNHKLSHKKKILDKIKNCPGSYKNYIIPYLRYLDFDICLNYFRELNDICNTEYADELLALYIKISKKLTNDEMFVILNKFNKYFPPNYELYNMLGDTYQNGIGIDINMDKAIYYFEESVIINPSIDNPSLRKLINIDQKYLQKVITDHRDFKYHPDYPGQDRSKACCPTQTK